MNTRSAHYTIALLSVFMCVLELSDLFEWLLTPANQVVQLTQDDDGNDDDSHLNQSVKCSVCPTSAAVATLSMTDLVGPFFYDSLDISFRRSELPANSAIAQRPRSRAPPINRNSHAA